MRRIGGMVGLTIVALSGVIAACGSEGGGSGGGTSGAGAVAGTSGSGPATGGGNLGGSHSGGSASGGSDSSGSGGEAMGGSGPGGSGGDATGGTAGTGSGTAGSGGAGEAAQCASDGDCTVYGDCCGCWSLAEGEQPEECPLDCADNLCDHFETPPTARCIFGRCTLSASCDASVVTCRQAAPECGEGMTPSVNGMCWGPCVEATECVEVTDCASCTLPAQACLYELGIVGRAHCVEVPNSCNDVPGCDCMEEFCGDFQPCTDTDSGISCGGG